MTRQGAGRGARTPPRSLRVICSVRRRAFGAKDSLWPYTVLAQLPPRQVRRPVKAGLTRRAQMYTSVGSDHKQSRR